MAFQRANYNPVRPFSRKGKILVAGLRGIFSIRKIFGGRDFAAPLADHHEDPLHMNRKQQLFFGHKYYYKAITDEEAGRQMKLYFQKGNGDLLIPDNFKAEKTITMTAGGDLMPYECINTEVCEHLWDEAGDFFFEADIVTANLETPVFKKKPASLVPEVMLYHMYFNGSEDMFKVFSGNGKYNGYDVISVANNHSLDQGVEGLVETMNFLKEKGIDHCGAASSEVSLNDFPIIEREGIRIAFLAATFSLNAEQLPADMPWLVNHIELNKPNPDISRLVEQVKIARLKGADLVVAHLHMGCAYQPYPSGHTLDNMHLICKATGIDLILGGHPHNAQPTELLSYKDPFTDKEKRSLIIYSMGDFVAYDIFKWCHLPVLYKFTISKGSEGTFITGVEPRFYYAEASFEKGKVKRLVFRDFEQLLEKKSFIDSGSKSEFEELRKFYQSFLEPGNIQAWLENKGID